MGKLSITILAFFVSLPLSAKEKVATLKASHTNLSEKIELNKIKSDFWDKMTPTVTKDKSSSEKIVLKAAYSDSHLFMRVEFERKSKTETHKRFVWNKENKIYMSDPNDIEDHFVIRWLFDDYPNASLLPREHKADVWFWKARRTNPAGYADDKLHVIKPQIPTKKKFKKLSLTDSKEKNFFLGRLSDKGKSSYEENNNVSTYKGEKIARYINRLPEGSRADVKALGKWESGKWVVLLKRKLDTGNDDDVSFSTSKTHYFGISLFEIADKPTKICRHFYGCGKISETFKLVFKKK